MKLGHPGDVGIQLFFADEICQVLFQLFFPRRPLSLPHARAKNLPRLMSTQTDIWLSSSFEWEPFTAVNIQLKFVYLDVTVYQCCDTHGCFN